MQVGKIIRDARIAKRMTQEELGQKLGVSNTTVARYESGLISNIKRTTLLQIAITLDIRPALLVGDYVEEIKPADDDGFTDDQKKLIAFAQSIPDDKAAYILRIMKSILAKNQ